MILPMLKIPINGQKRNYADLLMWISPATMMGLPATSAPIGKTTAGMLVNVWILIGSKRQIQKCPLLRGHFFNSSFQSFGFQAVNIFFSMKGVSRVALETNSFALRG